LSLRRVLANTALVLGSVAVSFVGLEIAYRLYDGVPVFSFDNYVVQSLDLIRANAGAMDHDPDLGWRLRSNLHAPGGSLTTGEHGLRMS
jgi:hypothetical protein